MKIDLGLIELYNIHMNNVLHRVARRLLACSNRLTTLVLQG